MRRVLGIVGCVVLLLGALCAVSVLAAPAPSESSPSMAGESVPTTAFDTQDSLAPTDSDTAASLEDPTESTDGTTFSSHDRILVRTTLDRTPSQVGEITATVSVEIPDRVTELTALLPAEADVQDTDGFSQASGTDYEWDGETDEPSVTFRITADRLIDREGPLSEDGRYRFADTEEWALVRIPKTSVSGRYTGSGEPPLVRETEVDGPGAAGEEIAFLGEHEVETHTAHGQTFELVVPEAADPAAEPEEVFADLSYATDRLRVGDRDETVFMVVAPTDRVEWAVRGLQLGESDVWVQDTETLDDPSNVWLHEYVHTRQDYRANDDVRWFTEGSATYYAALLALETGRIDFDEFRRFMGQGEDSPQASSTLSRPDRWENFGQYTKGALVAGEIDRQLRETSGGEGSLDDVFADLNRRSGEVDRRDFERSVGDTGDDATADAAVEFTTTEAVPSMWDETAHAAAFGQEPARFRFQLAETDPITVRGPDGERSADPPVTLEANETLAVEMVAENVGGTVGSYELSFRVDGTETNQTGRLDPGETERHRFEHRFEEPGEFDVRVGEESIAVRVEAADDEAPELPIEVETPGFGLVPAVLAVALLVAVGRIRRQD